MRAFLSIANVNLIYKLHKKHEKKHVFVHVIQCVAKASMCSRTNSMICYLPLQQAWDMEDFDVPSLCGIQCPQLSSKLEKGEKFGLR